MILSFPRMLSTSAEGVVRSVDANRGDLVTQGGQICHFGLLTEDNLLCSSPKSKMRLPFCLGQTFVANLEQVEVVPSARSSKLRDRHELIDDTLQARKGWRRPNVISEFREIVQQSE
jgi:hypothetical protein